MCADAARSNPDSPTNRASSSSAAAPRSSRLASRRASATGGSSPYRRHRESAQRRGAIRDARARRIRGPRYGRHGPASVSSWMRSTVSNRRTWLGSTRNGSTRRRSTASASSGSARVSRPVASRNRQARALPRRRTAKSRAVARSSHRGVIVAETSEPVEERAARSIAVSEQERGVEPDLQLEIWRRRPVQHHGAVERLRASHHRRCSRPGLGVPPRSISAPGAVGT